jgi:heat shock protein HslJ
MTLLSGCSRDESISKFVDPASEYHLVELNGLAFSSTATIAFPEQGRVVGLSQCMRFFASQTVPYPWFSLEGIGSTRMACPNLPQETAFFDALEGMTLAEVSGRTLILSDSIGRQMVFEAR